MMCNRQSRIEAVLLAAIVATGGALHCHADATIYRDCFEVLHYGDFRHVACMVDGLTDIHYAIDKFETNNWEVTWHGGGNDSRFVKAQPGEHVLRDNVFTNTLMTITGSAYPFVFEFYHWYKNGTSGKTWYGYVSLGLDENAELVILESAITDTQGALTVTGTPEPVPQVLSIRTIDHGDWLELDSQCIDPNTAGWVAIPPEIAGKPVRAIGRYAFVGCSQVSNMTIPDSIASIGDSAFIGCTALQKLQVPDSVTNTGESIVYQCDSLGELRLGGGLASIGCMAFSNSGMTNLVMSLGTTNIIGYAFAGNDRLKSVTIPESMERIQAYAFNGCSSLAEVSVPYATIVEDNAFPSGCSITRYGPYISVPGGLMSPDAETKIAMMRTLNWRDYAGLDEVYFLELQPPYAETPESRSAIYASAHLGISPAIIDGEQSEHHTVAYYKMPSVEFLDIDPANRVITGSVVPAEGTSIISPPLKRAFGFFRIYEDDGRWLEGDDWGHWLNDDMPGFSLDTSDYISSNGLFRITYGEDVLVEKYPQKSHLFKIKLSDKRWQLW